MFDDLKYLIEKSDLPSQVRIALAIATKLASWLPLAFVGVGLFLSASNFTYWLAFFIFAEGAAISVLLYILLLIVRNSLSTQQHERDPEDRLSSNAYADTALKGIVGNFAFYLFIIVAFIVVKSMGLVDGLLKAAIDRIN